MPVDGKGRMRLMTFQYLFHGVACGVQGRMVHRPFLIGRCKARRNKKGILFSEWYGKLVRQAQDHVPAGSGSSRFQKAEVTLGNVGF